VTLLPNSEGMKTRTGVLVNDGSVAQVACAHAKPLMDSASAQTNRTAENLTRAPAVMPRPSHVALRVTIVKYIFTVVRH
jgi:hypothetical protein